MAWIKSLQGHEDREKCGSWIPWTSPLKLLWSWPALEQGIPLGILQWNLWSYQSKIKKTLLLFPFGDTKQRTKKKWLFFIIIKSFSCCFFAQRQYRELSSLCCISRRHIHTNTCIHTHTQIQVRLFFTIHTYIYIYDIPKDLALCPTSASYSPCDHSKVLIPLDLVSFSITWPGWSRQSSSLPFLNDVLFLSLSKWRTVD